MWFQFFLKACVLEVCKYTSSHTAQVSVRQGLSRAGPGAGPAPERVSSGLQLAPQASYQMLDPDFPLFFFFWSCMNLAGFPMVTVFTGMYGQLLCYFRAKTTLLKMHKKEECFFF